MLVQLSSLELPIWPKVQLLQEYTLAIANVTKVHKTTVNVSNISHLLIPEELIVRLFLNTSVIFNLAIFIFTLILVNLILLNLQVIPFCLNLLVLFFAPA